MILHCGKFIEEALVYFSTKIVLVDIPRMAFSQLFAGERKRHWNSFEILSPIFPGVYDILTMITIFS